MKKTVYFIVLTAIVHILSACSGSTVYDEYAHTPIAGWEKNDTLSFEVSPLLEPGHYKQSLGLRITGAYPFMGLYAHRRTDGLSPKQKDTWRMQDRYGQLPAD